MNSIKVFEMPAIPPDSNPFHHDAYHMGTRLGSNVMAMFENHSNNQCKYLIIINITTGERLKVVFDNADPQEGELVTSLINKASGIQ